MPASSTPFAAKLLKRKGKAPMVTKVICIAGAAVAIVVLMFMVDRLLPRKDDQDSGGND